MSPYLAGVNDKVSKAKLDVKLVLLPKTSDGP